MRARMFVIIAAVLAASCGGEPKPAAPSPVAVGPSPSPGRPDECGAGAMQYLVGRPRTEIPAAAEPSRRRIYCSSCAVTMDYSPQRLNIIFDDRTGVIREVKCG